MSLDRFRRPRMIVLHPATNAYEAARAMAENEVGCVLIAEGHQLVGIVTDRDLVLELLARGFDPLRTRLSDIMSRDVVTLDIGASLADVTRIMRQYACRRIPILEDGRPVGLVTLDDLLVDGEFTQSTRLVVAAQLDDAARRYQVRTRRRDRRGSERPALQEEHAEGDGPSQLRHKSRAESTYARLLKAVERDAGLRDRAQAERALHLVLGAVCHRLTPIEARHLVAQLPSMLQPALLDCADGPDRRITTASIVADLRRHLGLDEEAATETAYAICEAVSDGISEGELESLRAQLPAAMRDLFPAAPYARSA